VSTLRLALAQINPIVGDFPGNSAKCIQAVRDARSRGAQVVALPEMVMTGYPVEDLALRRSFQQASLAATESLAESLKAEGLGQVITFVGYLNPNHTIGGKPYNSCAVIFDGRIVANYAKHHLPNYGVFDEHRYFEPGNESLIVRAHGVDIAVAICEDLWQDGGPVARVRASDAGLLLVLNGSPYERDKDDVRLELVTRRAHEAQATLAYVNMVGGQDELVFEGDSIIVSANGDVLTRAAQFEDELVVIDLELSDSGTHTQLPTGEQVVVLNPECPRSEDLLPRAQIDRLDRNAEVYTALVVGLRDYVTKNNFTSVTFGLSGGIDSAFVAALACDAIGADKVFGISMPSAYSSEHSKSDAYDLAARCGLNIRTIEIAPIVANYIESLHLTGLAEENLQARVRGTTVMGISNQEGHLVLATGNKSELSVGYSTIYGDAVGGFAPIKDLPKTDVWALSRWRNEQARRTGTVEPIPLSSIEKEPSAELRPGQKDSDSLPDYIVLDQILSLYVDFDYALAEIVERGFDRELVSRVLSMTDRAEYKRRQYPPGPKVSRRAFGRDRRLPMTSYWQE